MPPKRQRTSGLSETETIIAAKGLEDLIAKTREEHALRTEEIPEEELAKLERLEGVLQMLNSNRDAPQSYSFSSMTDDHLTKLRISVLGFLKLKTDLEAHLAKNDTLGADGLWSADMLYRHIQFLEGLVPRKNEAAARLWINAFFYRVASMTPNGKKMVLSVEQGIPSVSLSDHSADTMNGHIDWTAIATSPLKAERFLNYPRLGDLRSEDSTLFVSEAKGPNQLLSSHIPQAICEMYACARTMGKTRIRGVLTNGRGWIFLVLTLNSDGGGTYLQSNEISIYNETAEVSISHGLSRVTVSVVSSIIADWMTHSHEGFGADDAYFTSTVL